MSTETELVPSNIPDLPSIDHKVKILLDKWILLLKNLSPRIKIILSGEEKFNSKLKEFRDFVLMTLHIENEKNLLDWPELKEIAFLLVFDSSYPNHPEEFLFKNTHIYCYKNKAFGSHHFTPDWDEENYNCQTCSLRDYSEEYLRWDFISRVIFNEIERIENSVEELPKS